MYARVDRKKVRRPIRKRIRSKIQGTAERPRVSIYRSLKHMYAQAVDDADGATIACASTREKECAGAVSATSGADAAKKVGELLASRLKEKGVETIVFDRNGFRYHGRVRALADAAREAGLKF